MTNSIQIKEAIGKWPAQFTLDLKVYSNPGNYVGQYKVTIDHTDTVSTLQRKVAGVAKLNIGQIESIYLHPPRGYTERMMKLYSIPQPNIGNSDDMPVIDLLIKKFSMEESNRKYTLMQMDPNGQIMVDFGAYIEPYTLSCTYTSPEEKF